MSTPIPAAAKAAIEKFIYSPEIRLNHHASCRQGAEFGYSLCLQEKEERIKELEEALKPLANLDLVGVTGEIVYVRDKTQITVTNVNKAKKLLNQ